MIDGFNVKRVRLSKQLTVFSLLCMVYIYFLNRHQRRIKINMVSNIKYQSPKQECSNVFFVVHGEEYLPDPWVDNSAAPVLDLLQL